jgi:glycerol-3-phosphate O-acyltransferase/dihydroxyacetone phosphate acyltransferase
MGVEKKGTMMSELDYTKVCLLKYIMETTCMCTLFILGSVLINPLPAVVFSKAQLAFFYIVVLLSLDMLNPVKIFLHVFPAIKSWHIATFAIACMSYIFIVNLRELLYFATKVFFHSILSIFFNDVTVVGRENIPSHGPVIFTSNHANQFMDGLMIMCTCQRTISYLVADKSWNRPIIGHLAWMMGGVPVKRAQDSACKGTGKISIDLNALAGSDAVINVVGKGTSFTSQIKAGDKIRLPNNAIGIKVESIESDESMSLKVEDGVAEVLSSHPFPEYVTYDILPRIDQKDVYQNVLEKLASGGTIGIFPEGGSHDRTDLLPLKVGVALIAYSELEKDGINVPIVPVGLNYFRAHRFRGKATVEFGSPTYIEPSTLADYKKGGADKRRVCNDLLARIENSMRSVIVSVPDFETLQTIHAARRLYRQDGRNETAEQRQDMGRRFAEGYKRVLLQLGGEPPEEWLSLQSRILAYQKELNELGIRDYQVVGLDHEEVELGSESQGHSKADTVLHRMNVFGHIVHLFVIAVLAALPAMLLNLPVGLASRIYSNRRRKVALAASKVKVKGYDVMLSERVLACIVLVPSLWVVYGLLLSLFTSLDGPSLAVCFTCFPLFSYWSIMATESGMVDIKDLRPYVMRMIPSARRRLAALPATRKALRSDLRAMIKKIGPSLGDIYYEKDLNWQKIQMETKRMSMEELDPAQKDEAAKKEE